MTLNWIFLKFNLRRIRKLDKKSQAMEMKFLTVMLNITKKDRIRNTNIWSVLRVGNLKKLHSKQHTKMVWTCDTEERTPKKTLQTKIEREPEPGQIGNDTEIRGEKWDEMQK